MNQETLKDRYELFKDADGGPRVICPHCNERADFRITPNPERGRSPLGGPLEMTACLFDGDLFVHDAPIHGTHSDERPVAYWDVDTITRDRDYDGYLIELFEDEADQQRE